MSDPRALTRVLDELLWVLRRGGFAIATSQAIDAGRAALAVGLADRFALREALASVIVHRARDRLRFDAVFDRFFAGTHARGRTLWDRLAAQGFDEAEIGELRELLERLAASGADEGAMHLGALLERGAELDRLLQLAGVARTLEAMKSPLQAGFFTHRVLREIGVTSAHRALTALGDRLREALGPRGDALAAALRAELELASDEVRDHVRDVVQRRADDDREDAAARTLDAAPFASLSADEIDDVRRAVRAFAERLRGGERVRSRRARRGRLDPHRTVRRAFATSGVPIRVCRRSRRRDRARLVLLCDVSDSVRAAATFMLELVYVAHELFERTRSFVFVSDLGETTALFERESIDRALGIAYGGGVVSVAHNSNYGRVLRQFEERHAREIDRRTTVVILGDGRTNFHEDAADVVGRIRDRARAVVWLSPEPRAAWATGDSAMARYAPMCTEVLEVRSARELEEAARRLAALR